MAGPQTKGNGEIVPRERTKAPEEQLVGLLRRMQPDLVRAMPKHMSADRMMRIALTALRTNPKLAECNPGSFLGSVITAAQLGLEVNTPLGHAYLIPYKRECTLQIGYQGMMDLARRSGMVSAIYAYDVREGDTFSYQLGLNPDVKHVPSDDEGREIKKLTHVYAVAKLKDGEPVFTVLTRAQVDQYRKRSRASADGPWVTDYTAMALKTAIRRLFTWLPKSAEMALGATLDEQPERGEQQATVWDPTVTQALSAQGVEVPSEAPAAEVPAALPAETKPADTTDKPAERERVPGEDDR